VAVELPLVEDLRAIITSAKTDAELEAVIDDAALMVSPLACVLAYDGPRQAAIIKYVAADLLAGAIETGGGGALQSQTLGDASETYGLGGAQLGQSAYWKKALALDTDGCLATLAKPRAFFEKV
jgi:hypothetical protein